MFVSVCVHMSIGGINGIFNRWSEGGGWLCSVLEALYVLEDESKHAGTGSKGSKGAPMTRVSGKAGKHGSGGAAVATGTNVGPLAAAAAGPGLSRNGRNRLVGRSLPRIPDSYCCIRA